MRKLLLCLILAATAMLMVQQDALAGGRRYIANRWGERFARTIPWNGDYYYMQWGAPTALVVPPTANMQTSLSWGVSQTTMRPIYHQFSRPYPGDGEGLGVGFLPTPRWPSHTDQFGIYYVRGPWR
jgi:hypothetical protein